MVEGKIFTGEGNASEFLKKQPYRDFLSPKLEESIFPGTLNLKARPKKVERIKEEAKSCRMDPVQYKGDDLGGIDVYAVRAAGENALLVEPDLTRYGDEVMEIVASDNLRKAHDLEDGDHIAVEPR